MVFKKLRNNLIVAAGLFGLFFFATSVGAQDFGTGAVDSGLGGSLSATDPREIAGRIINVALGFLGVIAIGFIVYAGFLWMSSGGNEEKVSSAKNILKNAVIGLLVVMASWAIATFIITRLSGATTGGGGSYICAPGASLSCGCYSSGLMVCSESGSWGACVGQNCSSGTGGNPTSCDVDAVLPGCQAASQICSNGDYCDANTCSCLPKGGIGASCDADPASQTCEADSGFCGEFLTCNPAKGCTCDGPPVITSLSPLGGFCEDDTNKACSVDSDCASSCNTDIPNGAANNFITIFGKNFGDYEEGVSQVLFTGVGGPVAGASPSQLNNACLDSWQDDQIVIAVPAGVLAGSITVSNKDQLSDATDDDFGPYIPDFLPNNISRPGLCQLDPERGSLSAQVSYQGINLFSGNAYFGNYQNNIQALNSAFNQASGLTGQALIPNINPGVSGSFVERLSVFGRVRSNFLQFTKEAEAGEGPFISSFYPLSGSGGQYVTLRGKGFGGARGTAKVFFGSTEAVYDFPEMCLNSVWRDSQVIVKVPAGLPEGSHVISLKAGTTTIDTTRLNPNGFVSDPNLPLRSSLCKIEPDRGPAMTPVTLWGEYFGVINGEGLVKFNYDKTATGTILKDGRADMIKTKVPVGAISGLVKVVNNSYWGNELNFYVGECRGDSDCGTQICCPGGTYKAGLCSQSLESCYVEVPSSVFEWRFSTGFATSSTTTLPCVGPDCQSNDPCSLLTDLASCQAASACCYDDKNSKCRSGEQISSGSDLGYCAYYNCDLSGGEIQGGGRCAVNQPVKNGIYNEISSCEYFCANPPTGPGLSCAGYATSTCASNICNFPGFSCLLDSGLSGITPPACGSCCCQPGTVSPLNPELECIADQGACFGASRGLFCGCTRDDQCGAKESIGCGSGSCCEARPEVSGSLPEHLSDKVCRNSVLRVDFNQVMDASTFPANVLLYEEREYGNGVCPVGTFIVQNGELIGEPGVPENSLIAGLIKKLSKRLLLTWNSWWDVSETNMAAADLPDPDKLYCAVPGLVSGENTGQSSSLYFRPQSILSPGASYFLVIKGDEELNSRTGVMSIRQVGMNGSGYSNVGISDGNDFVEGENIFFNGRSYKNSHIIKFLTLSDQGPNSGICSIDEVVVSPTSYLINTAENGLDENDVNFNHPSFDTATDKDKLVSAYAVSDDNQILQPVTGYFWDWQFSLSNNDVASIATGSVIANLPSGKALVSAKSGVTDGETGVEAKIDMSRFKAPSCNLGSCSCAGLDCSNNCCNAYLGGDQFKEQSDLYIFLCNNPWPPVAANGFWSPWLDNCAGVVGGSCASYNYKFYYCRDAGAAGTLDDLPAIINQAVIRGASSNLVCSSDRTPCAAGSTSNSTKCGQDQNGDGEGDGICIWDVLKESYFFRAAAPAKGELVAVTNTGLGGQVKVDWRAEALINNGASQVSSFKIYYLPAGRGAMIAKEVKPLDQVGGTPVCQLLSGKYNCSYTLNGLSNNVNYIFKLSVVNVSRAESELSDEKSAVPTDTTPPAVPSGLEGRVIDNSYLRFSWSAQSGSTDIYRLYRGISSRRYGESFDSAPGALSLSLELENFNSNTNYFALSAVDGFGNESAKSAEVVCIGRGQELVCSPSLNLGDEDKEIN